MLRISLQTHSTICIFTRSHKKMWVSCKRDTKRDTKNVTNWPPYLWNHPYIHFFFFWGEAQHFCLIPQSMPESIFLPASLALQGAVRGPDGGGGGGGGTFPLNMNIFFQTMLSQGGGGAHALLSNLCSKLSL